MNKLLPRGKEKITLLNGKTVSVPKCSLKFKAWRGRRVKDSYGGKPIIGFRGNPVFAELAILRLLNSNGWEGVWVDTYRNKFRVTLPELQQEVSLPFKQAKIMDKMCETNGGRKGCWDVFAWKKNKILFVEAKRLLKDTIRSSQKMWLETALKSGFSLNNFLLVEWDLE